MNNLLSGFTEEQLKEELKKREEEREMGEIPQLIENPDFESLKILVLEYRDFVASDDFSDDNEWENWFYEGVIDTFFGKKFWHWYNKKV